MKVTIIIPTLNEASTIGRLLDRVLTEGNKDLSVIVVDGGSSDNTIEIAYARGVKVFSTTAQRAKQMNLGSVYATGDYLYFLHADTLPPKGFLRDFESVVEKGYKAAGYRGSYESKSALMSLNSFFTRFNWLIARGGDQSMFIEKKYFETLGRFDEQLVIMEEYPLIDKIMLQKQWYIIPRNIQISTRKYKNNSWFKVQRANYKAYRMFKRGEDSSVIRKIYEAMLA